MQAAPSALRPQRNAAIARRAATGPFGINSADAALWAGGKLHARSTATQHTQLPTIETNVDLLPLYISRNHLNSLLPASIRQIGNWVRYGMPGPSLGVKRVESR
jgi:hypothetical protein